MAERANRLFGGIMRKLNSLSRYFVPTICALALAVPASSFAGDKNKNKGWYAHATSKSQLLFEQDSNKAVSSFIKQIKEAQFAGAIPADKAADLIAHGEELSRQLSSATTPEQRTAMVTSLVKYRQDINSTAKGKPISNTLSQESQKMIAASQASVTGKAVKALEKSEQKATATAEKAAKQQEKMEVKAAAAAEKQAQKDEKRAAKLDKQPTGKFQKDKDKELGKMERAIEAYLKGGQVSEEQAELLRAEAADVKEKILDAQSGADKVAVEKALDDLKMSMAEAHNGSAPAGQENQKQFFGFENDNKKGRNSQVNIQGTAQAGRNVSSNNAQSAN